MFFYSYVSICFFNVFQCSYQLIWLIWWIQKQCDYVDVYSENGIDSSFTVYIYIYIMTLVFTLYWYIIYLSNTYIYIGILSIYLSVYLSIYLSIYIYYLSTYLSIYIGILSILQFSVTLEFDFRDMWCWLSPSKCFFFFRFMVTRVFDYLPSNRLTVGPCQLEDEFPLSIGDWKRVELLLYQRDDLM